MKKILTLVAILLVTACGGGGGGSPTAPTAAPTPTIATIISLLISGCTSDDNFQCRATATLSNSTTQDVTTLATWSSSNSQIATISAAGVVSPLDAGNVEIRASYQGQNATRSVVLTRRRFLLDGRIRETAPSSATVVAGASMRIVDGTNAGATATSDGNAYYVFPSIEGGTFNVQVSKDGYEPLTQSVTLSANRNQDFFLTPVRRTINETLTGTISGGDAVCTDNITPKPCARFSFGVHHTDTAEAVLSWAGGTNDLDLELWRGTTRLASSLSASRNEERVSSSVVAGNSYQWRVVYYSGSTVQSFTLTVRRPN